MIEAKKGNVNIYIQSTKLAGDVAVCICFDMNINSCCLNRLNCGWSYCDCNPSGIEEACVVYATYLNVNNLLCGDPVAMKSTKVGSTRCGSHNGHFFISWKVKGTVSAVRKSLGIALKGLVPSKLYSTYTHCARSVGCKVDRATFNWAADEVLKAIKSGVQCGVVGNIKADKEKVEKIVQIISKKLNPGTSATPKTKPSGHTQCDHKNVVDVKVSGWAAYVVKDYIMSKAKGVVPLICNKSLMIMMKQNSWDSLSSKLKIQSSDHIKARYGKVGPELGNVMAYLAISSGSVSCVDVKPLLQGIITAAQVTSVVKEAL
jgi:hypothetical protein